MSITFQIGVVEGNRVTPAEGCDCSRRWMGACDAADESGADYPDHISCEICDAAINLANGNAMDLMAWVGLDVDYCGTVPARELAPKVQRRLWNEARNLDPAIDGEEYGGPGTGQCCVISNGRKRGYLFGQCERLLALCERAGDRVIYWA